MAMEVGEVVSEWLMAIALSTAFLLAYYLHVLARALAKARR